MKSSYQIRPDSDGGGIQVSLKKMKPDWWPRLMYQQQKLSWLKVVDVSRLEDMPLIQYIELRFEEIVQLI